MGAHILFVFLLLAGILLLTGGSVAGVVKATREGMATTTSRVRRSTQEFAAVFTGNTTAPIDERTEPVEPPEEAPEVEPVVRATHVEAPALDAEERYPDLYGEEEPEAEEEDDEPVLVEPEPQPEPPIEEVEQESSRPQGNRRSAVTEADDIDYRMPKPSFLEALERRPEGRHEGHRAHRRRQLVDALSHFNVEAQGDRDRDRPARDPLRAAPGARHQDVEGLQLKDDLAYALAAEHVRILAPIPGKQAVGVEVPNRVRKMVHLGDVFQEAPQKWSPLTVWLGKDIAGQGDRHRPRQAAARARGRHHRLGQVAAA